jgi:thiol-disulfide isomerase/thioredoxin
VNPSDRNDSSPAGAARRRWLLAGAGIGAALAGAGWAAWRHRLSSPDDSTAFDDIWTLSFAQPQGGEFTLSALRGQVLVLNFWATWCPPCIRELPDLDRLHRERGAQVVGLAVDQSGPVREFLQRQPLAFPIGMAGFAGLDLSRRLGNWQGAMPFTAVFDHHGRLRHRKLGQTDFHELSGWVLALQA